MHWSGEYEYEPTRPPTPTLGPAVPFTLLLRATSALVMAGLVLTLALRFAGSILPAAPLLAYTVPNPAVESGRLHLLEPQRRITQAVPGVQAYTRLRWLTDGQGFVVRPLDGDPYAVALNGERRAITASEARLLRANPAPDGLAYVESVAGQLLFYHPDWIVQGYPLADGRALNVRDIAWSPDSRQLGLIIQAEGSGDLRHVAIVNIQTGRMETITERAAIYTDLHWTPNSERLAYIQSPAQIHVRDIHDAAELTVDVDTTVDTLAWSPGGDGLVYATRDGAIYRMDSIADAPDLLVDGLDSNTELVWSANGQWLAVSNGTLIDHDLWVLHLPTRRTRVIQVGVPAKDFIGWQP